jgi:ABC-type nitrate/sulfonate/bicarbonate transport system substrate-binding protein
MKLAVPDMISNSYFPAIAAVELGFFAREGIEVALELLSPADKAYGALADGKVDFVASEAHAASRSFRNGED